LAEKRRKKVKKKEEKSQKPIFIIFFFKISLPQDPATVFMHHATMSSPTPEESIFPRVTPQEIFWFQETDTANFRPG